MVISKPPLSRSSDVRLIGVDTPEVFEEEEPCGPGASSFTTERLEGEDVTLEFDDDRVDPFDRALAYVWVPDLDGELFNETLVSEGLARVDTVEPNTKYEERFLAAERQARDEGVGFCAVDPCTTSEVTTQEATTPEPTSVQERTTAQPVTTPTQPITTPSHQALPPRHLRLRHQRLLPRRHRLQLRPRQEPPRWTLAGRNAALSR